ncbi:hypothetical protein BGZ74_004429 [Mortierella antarctica]|nr:hypothetical protein BGZ74_004429 [Mortierella antarctica]
MQLQMRAQQQQQLQMTAMGGVASPLRPMMANSPNRPPMPVLGAPGGVLPPGLGQVPGGMLTPQLQARQHQQRMQQLQIQQQLQLQQQQQQAQQQQAQQHFMMQQATSGPQTPQDSSQMKEFAGSPGSQSGTPAPIISPVSAGMENMSMNSGGVDELGRIQNLMTDDSGFQHIENDGLQMEDMGVDAFGNVNLLSLGTEETQMSTSHSLLQPFGNLSGHGQKISTCAFSNDGLWLASAGIDRKILIWSVYDKELKATIEGPEGHTAHITNARFSPDDRLLLATASHDSTVRIWDLTPLAHGTGLVKSVQVLRGHKIPVTAVDFCPGGSNRCVSCDGDGELRLWDFMTGHCERVIRMSAKPVFTPNPVRFHSQNPNIVAVAAGTTLYSVQINDQSAQARPINTNHSKNISTLDWSSTGNLVTASDDQVCVWDTTQGNNSSQWRMVASQQSQKISSCAFLKSNTGGPAGRTTRLVYGDYEKIWVWTLNPGGFTNSPPIADPQAHPGAAVTALSCTSISLEGESALVLASASAGKDNNLKLWRVAA